MNVNNYTIALQRRRGPGTPVRTIPRLNTPTQNYKNTPPIPSTIRTQTNKQYENNAGRGTMPTHDDYLSVGGVRTTAVSSAGRMGGVSTAAAVAASGWYRVVSDVISEHELCAANKGGAYGVGMGGCGAAVVGGYVLNKNYSKILPAISMPRTWLRTVSGMSGGGKIGLAMRARELRTWRFLKQFVNNSSVTYFSPIRPLNKMRTN